MGILSDVSPRTFTLSAATIGFLLIDDFTANEQNALGNWFMLVGQILCTNASHQYVKNEQQTNNKVNTHPNNQENTTTDMLKKVRNALDKQINDMETKK